MHNWQATETLKDKGPIFFPRFFSPSPRPQASCSILLATLQGPLDHVCPLTSSTAVGHLRAPDPAMPCSNITNKKFKVIQTIEYGIQSPIQFYSSPYFLTYLLVLSNTHFTLRIGWPIYCALDMHYVSHSCLLCPNLEPSPLPFLSKSFPSCKTLFCPHLSWKILFELPSTQWFLPPLNL